MKIRTYFALPHKLQRSWICEGVVLKIWHRVQWLRYVTGEGRIYKMIITLCQGCRRIYGDDCTINVMKIASQQLYQVSANIPDSIVHQGDHLPRNVVVRNAVAEIQHI